MLGVSTIGITTLIMHDAKLHYQLTLSLRILILTVSCSRSVDLNFYGFN